MDIFEAIHSRHSVRSYTDKKLVGNTLAALRAEVEACNAKSGLNIQLVTDEPGAFSGLMAHYGKFRNVKNYLAMVGKNNDTLDEKVGYYGERLVLAAQMLGLNSCWVALTFRKGKTKCKVADGEKLLCVISIGYGQTLGTAHKSKPLETLCRTVGSMPGWFCSGMEAALLAPTATNQQKFLVVYSGSVVRVESTGGFYSKVDMGIVKYHFEVGAGSRNFNWA